MIRVNRILTPAISMDIAQLLHKKFAAPVATIADEDFDELSQALVRRHQFLETKEKALSTAIIRAAKYISVDRYHRPHVETMGIVDVDPRHEPYGKEAALINSGLDIQALYECRDAWGSANMTLDLVCRIACMVEWGWYLGWPRKSLGTSWHAFRNYQSLGADRKHGNIAVWQQQPCGEPIAGVTAPPQDSYGYNGAFVEHGSLYLICSQPTYTSPVLEMRVPEWWTSGLAPRPRANPEFLRYPVSPTGESADQAPNQESETL